MRDVEVSKADTNELALAWASGALADVLEPPEELSPSEFAAKHRYLKEGTTFRAGLWSNEVFPYLVSVMDAIEEAIRLGKRGVVLMKSGQGGGSEAIINALLWLKTMFSGPVLYLISKDELAKEFSRDRFEHAQETCEPIARKSITGYGSGNSLHQKRFTDGKLTICGGRSILNLQSEPRRFVIIDEVDSLLDECPDGDPLEIAEIRVDAFPGETLIIAFAHPTTATRGAGKLYYERSDQRRGHVWCPLCKKERFWLRWEHVKVEPHEGQTISQAERDPSAYVYRTPCCKGVLTDAARWQAVANGCEQISTLPEAQAKRKQWLGVHFSQLYMSNKTIEFLAEKWIEGIGDVPTRRVWINKRGGDVYREDEGSASVEVWERLRSDYSRGEVPPWVAFLTAGADFNSRHLHYAVWGWGLRLDLGGHRRLCGALIDYAELDRVPPQRTLDASDLFVLDEPLLGRLYKRPDGSGVRPRAVYADSGWQAQAVYDWCRHPSRRGRAYPVKGGSDDDRSRSPLHRVSKVPPYVVDGRKIDPALPLAVLNVFRAKRNLLDLVNTRLTIADEITGEFVADTPRILLPRDTESLFLDQAGAERLKSDGRKTWWVAKGANHLLDATVYAFAAAHSLTALTRGRTAKEIKHAEQRKNSPQARREQAAAAEAARRAGFRGRSGRPRGVRRRY